MYAYADLTEKFFDELLKIFCIYVCLYIFIMLIIIDMITFLL